MEAHGAMPASNCCFGILDTTAILIPRAATTRMELSTALHKRIDGETVLLVMMQ